MCRTYDCVKRKPMAAQKYYIKCRVGVREWGQKRKTLALKTTYVSRVKLPHLVIYKSCVAQLFL